MKNDKKIMKFRNTCNKMGLDWSSFRIYKIGEETLTIVKSPAFNLFVFFNSNYDLNGIKKLDSEYVDWEHFVEDFYNEYTKFTDILPFGDQFGYPFEDFTLRNIVDISNCVEIIETNHGHSLEYIINGERVERNLVDCKCLAYIKFLKQEMQQQLINAYSQRVLGYKSPDIYSYLRTIISKVEECIKSKISINIRSYPADIFSFLGQDSNLYNGMLLYDVIDLIMAENGYRCVKGTTNQIEKIPTSEASTTKLNVIMNQIKEISNLRKMDSSYQKIIK